MSKTKASLCVIAATTLTVMTLFLLPFTPKQAVRTVVINRGSLMKTTLMEGVVAYENQQPVVSLQAGRLGAVHAVQGQHVKAGQLLFAMDTALEEQALSALASRRYAAERMAADYGEEAKAVLANASLSWDEQEAGLRQAIEMKLLRAQNDGVVGAVYQREGDYVPAGAVLGLVHSETLCIETVWQPGTDAQAQVGAAAAVSAASGQKTVYACLSEMGAPSLDSVTGQYIQNLTFLAASSEGFDGLEVGERVMVEMLNQVSGGVPLAPVESLGEGNLLWLVRDGAATSVKIDPRQRNEQYIRVPETLLNERVVLLPDESELMEGRAVKEAKQR